MTVFFFVIFLNFSVRKNFNNSDEKENLKNDFCHVVIRVSDWVLRFVDLYFYSYKILRSISSKNLAISKQLYRQSAKVSTGQCTALSNHSSPWSNWWILFYILQTGFTVTFLMSFWQMIILQTSVQWKSTCLIDQKSISCVFKIIDLTLQTIKKTDSVRSENLFFLSWQH